MANNDVILQKLMEVHRDVGVVKSLSEDNRDTVNQIKHAIYGHDGLSVRIASLENDRTFIYRVAAGVAAAVALLTNGIGKAFIAVWHTLAT